jgi:hypothetical protein
LKKGPSPRFFVSVASKGFDCGVSSLDAIVADGWIRVDFKRFSGTEEAASGE